MIAHNNLNKFVNSWWKFYSKINPGILKSVAKLLISLSICLRTFFLVSVLSDQL